jgi:hypothetical protein
VAPAALAPAILAGPPGRSLTGRRGPAALAPAIHGGPPGCRY